MNKEPQPRDRSDAPPLSPKELLRQTVFMLATRETVNANDMLNWGISEDTVKWGIDRFPGRFVVAQIRDPRLILKGPILEILPEQLLTLTAYDSKGRGNRESIMITNDSTDIVLADIGEQEFDNMSPKAEDEFILDFYERNRLNKFLKLLAFPPRDS